MPCSAAPHFAKLLLGAFSLSYPSMDDNSLLPSISLLAVFISALLTVFLLTVKTRNRLPNVLFGSFLLLNAVDLSSWFLNAFLLRYPTVLLFKITLNTLINPLFYLYVVAVCYSDFQLKAKHLLHLLPFALLSGMMLPRFYLADTAAKLAFLQHYSQMPEATVSRIGGHLLFVFYLIAVFRTLRRYQRTYVENYADAANRTYRWLFRLTSILAALHTIILVKEVLRYTGHRHVLAGIELWVGLNAIGVLSWSVLQALYQPTLFRSIDLALPTVAGLLAEQRAPELTLMQAVRPEIAEKIRHLRTYMEQAEPYLEPSLTVQDLARQLQLPVRELSLLINHHLDQHFFDFVNEYRIAKARHLLKDPTHKSTTVLEILYAVGFNSKSSFNTAFKKQTGLTPTQYRAT